MLENTQRRIKTLLRRGFGVVLGSVWLLVEVILLPINIWIVTFKSESYIVSCINRTKKLEDLTYQFLK